LPDRAKTVLAIACTVLFALLAWRTGLMERAPRPAPVVRPRPPVAFESPWKTEQEWLVDFIVRDLAGTAAYAATGRAPRPEDLKLEVSQEASPKGASPTLRVSASLAIDPGQPPRTVREELRLEPHLWAPAQYEGIARAFLGTEAVPSPASTRTPKGGEARLLGALLDLRASTLLRENRTLSDRLKANPRDPAAHEDAALLVGAFALRDAAGWFEDTRPALCRMTAHLALGGVFGRGDGPGLSARYAQAILLTLVGRERDALELLAELERSAVRSPDQAAWIRALRLRNTRDWRLTADVRRLTLLEKLAEFRALAWMVDTPTAVERLDRRGAAEALPDWGRMVAGYGASVETGQRFATLTLAGEMQEVQEAWTSLRGEPPEENAWIEGLNESPGGLVSGDGKAGPGLDILDWGAWASSGQRHVLHELRNYERLLKNMLALKEEGKSFAKGSREQFGGLRLYPILEASMAEDGTSYHAAMRAARTAALKSPERLTPGCWVLLRWKPDFAEVPRDLPDQTSWFSPPLPSGTLLVLHHRLEYLPGLVTASAEQRRHMRELAPYQVNLAEFDVQRSGSGGVHQPPEQLARAFGPVSEYNVRVMGFMANAAWYDTPSFKLYQGRLCDVLPKSCFVFGHRLAELHLDDEAAAAYQKAFDRARDRVDAANRSRWLVDYYFDHAQKGRALKVAREAAETYSWGGLFVMARLMERMGRLDEAELYYGRLLERYEDKRELLGFFYRQARVARNPAYERRLQKMIPEVFPAGLEEIDRAKLPSPPRDGVVVRGENDNTLPYGIKWGHVIVGLDGFRVHSFEQYDAVRSLSQSPEMTLLVWRGHGYDEVKVKLWDRRFQVDMPTYKPGS
jgi:hypothetical protein